MVTIWCVPCNSSGNPARPEGVKRERYNPHGVRRVSASTLESAHSKFIERGNTMYQEQILKIFREFEKEERRGGWIEAFADEDSLNYKLHQAKKDFLRPQRFLQFLQRRRDLLDSLEKSIIENCKGQIEKGVEQTAKKELQKIADKMTGYYFKLNK